MEPQQLSALASSLTVRRPSGNIPYILTSEEEVSAILSHEGSIRDRKRWFVIDRGGNEIDVDDHVEVDISAEYDRNEILQKANRIKYWEIRDAEILKERQARLISDRKSIITEWNAEKMYRRMAAKSRDMGRELIVNDDTLPLIKVICYRLSVDKRLVTEMCLDPRKGIMLRGNPGTGKSWLINLLSDNPRHPVQIHTLIEITENIKRHGFYNGITWDAESIVYLDDVGTEEPVVSYYGTKIKWFKNYIEGYYMKSRGHYDKLIISTNDSFDELEEKYGKRVRSRLAEMFNIVDVTGPDLRKI